MPPLLFIIFNRPDHTRITFDRIRTIKPPVLFVAADAPRDGVAGEAERTESARAITEAIDWPCEVHRHYAENNLGCGKRISSAISHVLTLHESVIILEDDCVPDPTFFPYCEDLLQQYANDQRVMAISGDNFQKESRTDASYYFSRYPHCWGWATWRRAWQHHDLEIADWPKWKAEGLLDSFCETDRELSYWTAMMDMIHSKEMDTWDLQWTICCWMQNGLTVLPNKNLVSNIGFDSQGTHTLADSPYANLPTEPMGKLVHPTGVFRHRPADQFTDDLLYSGPWHRNRRKRRRLFSFRRAA